MRKYEKLVQIKSDGATAPDDADMALINAMALKTLAPEDVYVRREWLCDNQVDRSHEWFPLQVLQQFAVTIPTKSVLVGHDYGAAPLGRYFRAEIEERPATVLHLTPTWYTVKTRDNEHARAQIDGGVWAYKSIGFYAQDLICDICGASWYSSECPHEPGREYPGEDGIVKRCTVHYAGEAEAVEGSIVYLGAQPGARIIKAHDDRHVAALLAAKQHRVIAAVGTDLFPQVKTVIPYKRTPLADEGEAWDAAAEVAAADVDMLKIMCAWYDAEKPDNKTSYKLPHHKAEGEYACVWRGVAACMAVMMGARGGVDIPEADRAGVMTHIEKHYKDFDKDVPKLAGKSVFASDPGGGACLRQIEWANDEQAVYEELQFADATTSALSIGRHFVKEGRVLSARNLALVEAAIEALTALRDAARIADATEDDEKLADPCEVEELLESVLAKLRESAAKPDTIIVR